MDVVGKHIVLGLQYGQPLEQPGAWRAAFTVWGINTGNTQYLYAQAAIFSEVQQALFGIHTAARTVSGGVDGLRLAHPGTGAIAIHPGGGAIDHTAGQPPLAQYPHQMGGACIRQAMARRRRHVDDMLRNAPQTPQAVYIVQIALQWRNALLLQLGYFLGAGGERQNAWATRVALRA